MKKKEKHFPPWVVITSRSAPNTIFVIQTEIAAQWAIHCKSVTPCFPSTMTFLSP